MDLVSCRVERWHRAIRWAILAVVITDEAREVGFHALYVIRSRYNVGHYDMEETGVSEETALLVMKEVPIGFLGPAGSPRAAPPSAFHCRGALARHGYSS